MACSLTVAPRHSSCRSETANPFPKRCSAQSGASLLSTLFRNCKQKPQPEQHDAVRCRVVLCRIHLATAIQIRGFTGEEVAHPDFPPRLAVSVCVTVSRCSRGTRTVIEPIAHHRQRLWQRARPAKQDAGIEAAEPEQASRATTNGRDRLAHTVHAPFAVWRTVGSTRYTAPPFPCAAARNRQRRRLSQICPSAEGNGQPAAAGSTI